MIATMTPLDPSVAAVLETAAAAEGPVVFLTGAGISAESGIPTFRGAEGFWQVGSRHYQPQELATYAAFRRMPAAIWAWYLHRYSRCRAAKPNRAHLALAALETRIGDGFLLVTQNVDGLHPRAGNSTGRTYRIHGDLDLTRCAAECSPELTPMPPRFAAWERGRALDDEAREALTCTRCGDWLRPHVLWFDECYDEARYHFESSMAAAAACRLLVVVGTSGATTLPMHVATTVADRGGAFLVVDPEPSTFAAMAQANPNGCFVRGKASDIVPAITRAVHGDTT
jgi:NAD-dependent protein deacetylase/lipoamidase